VREEWAVSEKEFQDIVNAGALDLIEETVRAGAEAPAARKWWMNELSRRATEQGVELTELPVTPADVVRVSRLVAEGTINDKLARQVFDGVLAGEGTPDEVVEKRGLKVVSDEGELATVIDEVIAANPDVAEKIRGGKVAAAGALVGAVMKATRGQADAGRARELIIEKLTG
jgi:aspartyl-tRNA(Asn)/glutamyl-tRNA(Gln) amidotransferase subunit B